VRGAGSPAVVEGRVLHVAVLAACQEHASVQNTCCRLAGWPYVCRLTMNSTFLLFPVCLLKQK
jgi:hypothetical protein